MRYGSVFFDSLPPFTRTRASPKSNRARHVVPSVLLGKHAPSRGSGRQPCGFECGGAARRGGLYRVESLLFQKADWPSEGRLRNYASARMRSVARTHNSNARLFISSFSVGQPQTFTCLGCGLGSSSVNSPTAATSALRNWAKASAAFPLGSPARSPRGQMASNAKSSIQNADIFPLFGGVNPAGLTRSPE